MIDEQNSTAENLPGMRSFSPRNDDAFARMGRAIWSPAGLFALIIIYVLFSRLWDLAGKVMHHDESLFAYYGYWLFKGRGYDYQPILHGPVLQFVSAFFFLLFGDDQWTMRLPSLIGGLLMFPVAWCWRRYLGGGVAAVLAATALIALSPSISFYARFLRNDVSYLTATMWCALCTLRLLHTGRPIYAWGAILAATLMFCMMESSIFFFAACIGYLATMVLIDLLIWRHRPGVDRGWPWWLQAEVAAADKTPASRRLQDGAIGLLAAVASAVVTCLGAWVYYRVFFQTLPVSAPLQAVGRAMGLKLPELVALGIVFFCVYICLFFVLLLSLLNYRAPRGGYGLLGWLAHALWRNRWHVVAALAVAVIAYTTLFTTFFTFTKTASFDHTARDFVGPEKALTPFQIYQNTWDYWWDQHKLHRIKGPFHYYLPILFLYELPILALVGLGWLRAIRACRRPWVMAGALVAAHIVLAVGIAIVNPIDWDMMDKKFHLESPAHLYLILLYAELLVVIAPLLFRQGRRAESFITYWGITSLFAYSYAGEKVPWLTIHTVGPLALLASAELVRLWRGVRWRRFHSQRNFAYAAFITIAIVAVVYQVRNNHLLLFVHPWSPAERLVYNHTSPDMETAVEIIGEVGQKTNFGIQLPVYMQGEMGWPLHWYLRDYTNILPSPGETAETTTRPVVMVDWQMAGIPNLQENYTLRRMKVREWWEPPMLDLGAMADIYMVFTPQESRESGLAAARYETMWGEWRKLWHYMAYREIWIDPQNRNWSNGANEFCFAVRKDLAERLLTYPWLAATPKRADVPVFIPY
jgi:uncharacterized protein (TIGR03663 family)